MKIRIYSPYFPYPSTEGAFQVIGDQARSLLELGHEVEMVVWKDGLHEIQKKLRSMDIIPIPEKLLLRSLAVPATGLKTLEHWRNLSAPLAEKKQRTSQSERFLRVGTSLYSDVASPELFYYPTFEGQNTLPLCDLGIYHYSFSYSWLKSRIKRETKQVVVFHNIESDLFKLRGDSETSPSKKWVHRLNENKLKNHEIALGKLADELWMLSPVDLKEMKFRTKTNNLRLVPPTFNSKIREVRKISSPGHNLNLGFVGGLDFEPNLISLEWIVDVLCPNLSGFTGKILIAGKGLTDPKVLSVVERAKKYSFLEFLGFVPDLTDFWASLSFLLVPDLGGSGVRIKVLDAVASGIPVLTTRDSFDRLHQELRKSKLIKVFDNTEEWSKFILNVEAFSKRLVDQEEPFNPGLLGKNVYGFLGKFMNEKEISNRILFVKIGALGDVSYALPSIEALKKVYTKSYITWVVGESSRDLLQGSPFIDEIVTVNENNFYAKKKTIQVKEVINLHKKLRGPYDLCFVAHRDNLYSLMLKPLVKGPLVQLARRAQSSLLDHLRSKIVVPPLSLHESLAIKKLVEAGVKEDFKLRGKEFDGLDWTWNYDHITEATKFAGDFVVIHLGGGKNLKTEFELKKWPHWKIFLERVLRETKLEIVLIGAKSEAEYIVLFLRNTFDSVREVPQHHRNWSLERESNNLVYKTILAKSRPDPKES